MSTFLGLAAAPVDLTTLAKKRKWFELAQRFGRNVDRAAFAALVTWRYGLPDLQARLGDVVATGNAMVQAFDDHGAGDARARGSMFKAPHPCSLLPHVYYFALLCGVGPSPRLLELLPDAKFFTSIRSAPMREIAAPTFADAALISHLVRGDDWLGEVITTLGSSFGRKLLRETFRAYVAVLEAIRARDAQALGDAVADCERCFGRRGSSDAVGFGGSMMDATEDVVDFRLAAILAAHRSWAPAAKIETIHKLPAGAGQRRKSL